jgi:stage II sporulation protein AA (anti-sigma F factor antagonist)
MNNFTLLQASEHGTVFLRPRGYLDDLGAEQIFTASERALKDGCRQIVCNCADIRFINSIGISILFSLIQQVRDTGSALCFTNVSKVHQTVFDIVGITRLVPMYGSERDALQGLCERR